MIHRRNTLLFSIAFALATATAPAQTERTWTSADGRTLVGTLLDRSDTTVTIRRSDGRRFDLPLDQLSAADRDHLASAATESARRRGLAEGPYAATVRDTWVKFPAEKHGLIFQLYIGGRLSGKGDTLYPLFVHLHGAGARAGDVETGNVEIAATRLIKEEQYARTPALVCVPLCPPDVYWGAKVAELNALIDDLCDTLPVDRDRIYLSGYSMGARGIASLLLDRPKHYAAAMFADGEADPSWADTIEAALWLCYSGERDIDKAKATADAFTAAGKTVRFEAYPEAIHNQIHWKLTENPEVYDWIFQQSLKDSQ